MKFASRLKRIPFRFPIVALGILALLAALWGALSRLGWNLPLPNLASAHAPLMISGFLGTLVSLERAVALRARWAYVAPVASALGALILISGVSGVAGALLIVLGSVGMVAIFFVIVRRLPALYTYTMLLGALAWFVGNVIWFANVPIFRLVQWWAAFLILTIVGERLELSRLLRLARAIETLYALAVGVLMLGLSVDTLESVAFPFSNSTWGIQLIGVGLLALALWLLRFDIARRTVRQTGLTRFIAWCLLLGYVWLAVGGILRALEPYVNLPKMYDATLHAIFLGFVMSMIFGHAPIILPAVLGRALPYRPLFYAPLVLLHLSLALRIGADLAGGLAPLWQWAGVLNVVAVLFFLFNTARAVFSARPLRNAVPS